MSNQKDPAGISRRGITILILVFIAVITALAACVALLLARQGSEQTAQNVTAGTTAPSVLDRGFVSEDNVEEIASEMSDKVKEGMFECSMTTTWTFDDANAEAANSYVANVERNQYTMYFDVYEEETNELLYSSPMLPVGTDIRNIKLDKGLAAGEYKAVVMYTMVDENYEEVSSVGFKITILVLH